jgi:hypothetical protein
MCESGSLQRRALRPARVNVAGCNRQPSKRGTPVLRYAAVRVSSLEELSGWNGGVPWGAMRESGRPLSTSGEMGDLDPAAHLEAGAVPRAGAQRLPPNCSYSKSALSAGAAELGEVRALTRGAAALTARGGSPCLMRGAGSAGLLASASGVIEIGRTAGSDAVDGAEATGARGVTEAGCAALSVACSMRGLVAKGGASLRADAPRTYQTPAPSAISPSNEAANPSASASPRRRWIGGGGASELSVRELSAADG